MARFHIGKRGKPAQCRARKGACPLGGESTHFDNKEDAQKYLEKENTEKYSVNKSVSKNNEQNNDSMKKNDTSSVGLKKRPSARERMKASKAARLKDIKEVLSNTLIRNESDSKIIDEDEDTFSVETYDGRKTKVTIENNFDMNFRMISTYHVEGYGSTTNQAEMSEWIVKESRK